MTWKFIYIYRQRCKTAWTPPTIYWTRPVTCVCLCSTTLHLGSCESNAAWVKTYTVEQHVILVHKYWQTGSFKACQMAFQMEFGERRAPSKCCIQKLVKKLETTGSLLTQHAGGHKMFEETIHDVKEKEEQFQHRLWAGPALHCCRYVYINFQVIISITKFFIDNSLVPLARESPCIKTCRSVIICEIIVCICWS